MVLMPVSSITLRVYGILINEQQQVLVSDEYIRGNYFTKFPGGGLETGEGTRDCLIREFMEEMNLRIRTGEHIYTTDYFQPSAFNPAHQILSIYYFAHPLEPIRVPLKNIAFDYDTEQLEHYNRHQQVESFRFIDWDAFTEECLSLPIDKQVARILKEKRQS